MLWSPFEAAHIVDPYPMYERLRTEAPVHRAQTGEYLVTRYSDVRTILKSSAFRSGNRLEWLSRGIDYFKNHDEDLSNIYRAVCSFILFLNPPDHTAVRGFITKTWDDRNVASIITEVVDDCLKDLPKTFDLVKDFAQPVPARVICRIMGIPLNDFEYLRGLGVTMVRSLDLYHSWKDLVELNNASGSFVTYFTELIKRKPAEGLLGKLISANEREKVLSEQQMISIAIFLFIAGEETTAISISKGLYNFAKDPAIYQQLRQDRSLLRTTALEEFFRFDGPVHLLGRISNIETTIGNTAIPRNSAITLAIASANRDEEQFPEANGLNLTRSPNQHLAFGHGTHFCMGEWLGKLQSRIAFERFIAKFRSVSIPQQEIRWFRNIAIKGMTSLTINTSE
jgi:cytochrome P450